MNLINTNLSWFLACGVAERVLLLLFLWHVLFYQKMQNDSLVSWVMVEHGWLSQCQGKLVMAKEGNGIPLRPWNEGRSGEGVWDWWWGGKKLGIDGVRGGGSGWAGWAVGTRLAISFSIVSRMVCRQESRKPAMAFSLVCHCCSHICSIDNDAQFSSFFPPPLTIARALIMAQRTSRRRGVWQKGQENV